MVFQNPNRLSPSQVRVPLSLLNGESVKKYTDSLIPRKAHLGWVVVALSLTWRVQTDKEGKKKLISEVALSA